MSWFPQAGGSLGRSRADLEALRAWARSELPLVEQQTTEEMTWSECRDVEEAVLRPLLATGDNSSPLRPLVHLDVLFRTDAIDFDPLYDWLEILDHDVADLAFDDGLAELLGTAREEFHRRCRRGYSDLLRTVEYQPADDWDRAHHRVGDTEPWRVWEGVGVPLVSALLIDFVFTASSDAVVARRLLMATLDWERIAGTQSGLWPTG
jgi:hypothetical protein